MERIAEFRISEICEKSDCKYRNKCAAVDNPCELTESEQVKPALFVKANQFGRITIACETQEKG